VAVALILTLIGVFAIPVLALNTIERVSVDSAGAQGNNSSEYPSISADGRYVAFQSSASNLVAGDTNLATDIFVRDRQTNTTTRVSLDSAGAQGNNNSREPSISGDGRYVTFHSTASNLVAGDSNGCCDIFVRDRQTNTTIRVSLDSAGTEGNSHSYYPNISADGRYVTFDSWASNLVTGDTNGTRDIFVSPAPYQPYQLPLPSNAQVAAATGTGMINVSIDQGGIQSLTALNQSQLNCPPKVNVNFPHGFLSFNITNLTPGAAVIITITLPSNMPIGTQYWKCQNGAWIDCTSLLGSDDGDNVLTLRLCDGGQGDADGAANGTIVDPGGPGMAMAAPAAPHASPALQRQLNPPQMSLQYLSVNPQQAAANQPVAITTNVVNTGDAAGSLNVALKINCHVEQTRMVSVGPQDTQPVKFTVTRAQPGTYSVDILDQNGSFTILGANGTADKPVNGGIIAIIVMAILILVTAVMLMRSFRRTA